MAEDELKVGPLGNAGAAAAGTSEEGQLHRPGIDGLQRETKVFRELVCAGEADLGKVHTEAAHALQQVDCAGNGDLEIGLLEPVAKAGVEELNLRRFSWIHCVFHCDKS